VNCTASARKPGAEQILTDELKGRGLRDRDLANRRKNDPFKLEIAARLRRETTLRIKDIAARMHLASSKLRTQICTPMQKSEKGNRKRNEPPDRTNLWADPFEFDAHYTNNCKMACHRRFSSNVILFNEVGYFTEPWAILRLCDGEGLQVEGTGLHPRFGSW